MPLSGEDVWKAMVRLGFTSGPYDPETDRCANADRIAGRLNQVLRARKSNWLPKVMQTEDAIGSWEAGTSREYVLRLYKFLNTMGYTAIGIDAAIERERKKNEKPRETIFDFSKNTQP